MKALMSKDSIQRMTWLTYGNQLHEYLGSDVPKEYGGKGAPLEGNAITPRYAVADAGESAVAAPAEPPAASSTKRAGEAPSTE